MNDIFETPKFGLILALFIEVGILIWWSVKRNRVSFFCLSIGPLVAVFSILIDFLVETHQEQAIHLTQQISQATEDENAAELLNLCSDTMKFEGLMSRDEFEERVQVLFNKPLIQTNHNIEIQVLRAEKNAAQVKFRVATIIDPKSPYRSYTPLVKTAWLLDYERNSQGKYRLKNAVMMELEGGKPANVFDLVKIR